MRETGPGDLAAENARLRSLINAVREITPFCDMTSVAVEPVRVVRLADLHKALGLCTARPGGMGAVCELPAGHDGDQHRGGDVAWTAGGDDARPLSLSEIQEQEISDAL